MNPVTLVVEINQGIDLAHNIQSEAMFGGAKRQVQISLKSRIKRVDITSCFDNVGGKFILPLLKDCRNPS